MGGQSSPSRYHLYRRQSVIAQSPTPSIASNRNTLTLHTPEPYRIQSGVHKGKTLEECGERYIAALEARIKNDSPAVPENVQIAVQLYRSQRPVSRRSNIPRQEIPCPGNRQLTYHCDASNSARLHLQIMPLENNLMNPSTALKVPLAPSPPVPQRSNFEESALKSTAASTGFDALLQPTRTSWTPPELSTAPGGRLCRFRHNGSDISIMQDDAHKFFKLSLGDLQCLPKSSAQENLYFLYHVWDFVKVHQSRLIADESFESFRRKDTVEKHLQDSNWKPPSGPIPYRFQDRITGEDLWISPKDTVKFFQLEPIDLDVIPKASVGFSAYWAFHIWDYVKVHQSRSSADEAFIKFLRKNEKSTALIWSRMGIGSGEIDSCPCCGNGMCESDFIRM
jgi:hypothetical protein